MLVQPVARMSFFRLIAAGLALWFGLSRQVTAVQAATVEARPDTVVALLPKVIPTVVAIHTRRVAQADGDSVKPDKAPKIERAEGSGFIVSADGFIATNKHVVSGAYEVAVVLHDGTTIEARIVWESAVVDVAFLKIEAGHPLQAATLAPDGSLSLGQRVVAIGNPMGLGISASAGIVSALGRNLDQSPYDDFIQTDAAINPGNSGGPLFDLAGQVVGMNSILWTAGSNQGSQGLGFAIPGADITFLIDQIRRDGRIACGVLGVHAQKLTPAIAAGMDVPGFGGVIVATIDRDSAAELGLTFGVPDGSASDAEGAVVSSGADSSEAQVAGLSRGDVILSLQMIPLTKERSFDEVFARCGREGRRRVLAMVRETGGDRWIILPVRIDAGATPSQE